jgi:segregation and condensation protein B
VTHDPVPSQESLAQQAASWVPPWQREHPPTDSEAAPEPIAPDETRDMSQIVDEDRAQNPDRSPAGEPEPVAALAEPEAESAVEPVAALAEPEPVLAEPGSEPSVAAEAEFAVEPVAAVAEPEAAPAEPEAAPEVETVQEPVQEPVAVIPAQPTVPAAEKVLPSTMDQRELISALEAILMVVDEPVGEILLAQVLEQPADLVALTLRDMSREYAEEGRGFDLRQAAGGWRFYTRERYASYVERFVLDGQSVRLTQAALETLAVVAYKQPVTRSRISAIRGVNCDGVVRTLISRGLIEECGSEPESGAHLYRTTGLFLEKLGLDSVGQLPPLAPFLPDNVEEIADAER